jgi:uncharacterized protein (TIGR03083 family)
MDAKEWFAELDQASGEPIRPEDRQQPRLRAGGDGSLWDAMAEVTKAVSAVETWPLIHEQRDKLGDLLETLADAEWGTLSLCQGWRVRDVVAHCIQTHLVTGWSLLGDWIASGFSLEARNERGVARRRSLSPAELLGEYRATAGRTSVPPGQLTYSLVEAVVHGEDIARPVGRRIDVSPRSLVTVAELCRGTDPILGGKRRSAGLTLRATDVAWSTGTGPEVAGPLASIVLAITGRAAALDDLSGEGLETLRSRV